MVLCADARYSACRHATGLHRHREITSHTTRTAALTLAIMAPGSEKCLTTGSGYDSFLASLCMMLTFVQYSGTLARTDPQSSPTMSSGAILQINSISGKRGSVRNPAT
jgi:hypothetical protein